MQNAASQDPHSNLEMNTEKSEGKPWKEKCSSACYHAKTDRKHCKCKCRGELHGRDLADRLNEKRISEFL